MCDRKTSFTLAELLVTVSIIIILMSLILPALGKAKETGRTILCLSNEKQCAISGISYAGDFNGYIMVYSATINWPWTKFLYRNGYMNDFNSSLCPSWTPHKYDSTISGMMYFSYGMLRYRESNSFFLRIVDDYTYRALIVPKVTSPSDYFFYSDSLSLASGIMYQQQGYEYTVETWGVERIHARHSSKANIVFLDGHGETAGEARIATAARKINGDASFVKIFDKNMIEKQLYP